MGTSSVITLYRGDSLSVRVDVKGKSSSGVQTPLNVTGATAKLSVKRKKSTPDYLLQVEGTVEDGAAGTLLFEADPPATELAPGTYAYDVEVTWANGKRQTVVEDVFEVKEDVTRSA